MIKLDSKTISQMLNYKEAMNGVKINQTGILQVTKENQRELTKYLNIQTNKDTGYEKIDLNKPINVGEVDMAKYGEKYYDILDKQGNLYSIDYENNKVYQIEKNEKKEIPNATFENNAIDVNGTKIEIEYALKAGISIMIQKNGYDELGNPLPEAEFDIYPNPNPFQRYTSVNDVAEKTEDKSLVEKKDQIKTGIPLIDDNVKMYLRTDRSTTFMSVENVLKQLDVFLITKDKEQLLKPGGFVAIEKDENGNNIISHAINKDKNGNPIGYHLSEKKDLKISNLFEEIYSEASYAKNKVKELQSTIKEKDDLINEQARIIEKLKAQLDMNSINKVS